MEGNYANHYTTVAPSCPTPATTLCISSSPCPRTHRPGLKQHAKPTSTASPWRLPSPRFRGVVVITSALHAEGPQFDPGRNQLPCFVFVSLQPYRFAGPVDQCCSGGRRASRPDALPASTPWRNGSASDSRSEGCVFKSRRGHAEPFCLRAVATHEACPRVSNRSSQRVAFMAQWLEHRSRKPGVGSSNLPGGTLSFTFRFFRATLLGSGFLDRPTPHSAHPAPVA